MIPGLMYDNGKVTVELRELVQSGINVWDFQYPSYYEGEEKKAFEQKVLDHYWFRQIGQETPARWLHYFRSRMREIMPYYIQLYKSEALMQSIDDPFGNVDVTETFQQTSTGTLNRETTNSTEAETTESSQSQTTGSSTSETTDNKQSQTTGSSTSENDQDLSKIRKHSDTPQGTIDNLDEYMSEATQETETTTGSETTESTGTQTDTGSSTSEASSTGSQTDTGSSTSEASSTGTQTDTESGTVTHTLTRKGNQGVNTYAHDMKELRETFLNIDMQIIHELNDLFLMVY